MFIIALFPILSALLGWVVFKIFSILMTQNIEKQKGSLFSKISLTDSNSSEGVNSPFLKKNWEQITQFVTEPLINKIQFAGTILGFVLGILFVLMVLVYGYIYNMM